MPIPPAGFRRSVCHLGFIAISVLATSWNQAPYSAARGDEWTIKQNHPASGEASIRVIGRTIAEREEVILILSPDQRMWRVTNDDVVTHTSSNVGQSLCDRDALQSFLTSEFPDFQFHSTEHYLLVFDVLPDTARLAGRLLERVHESYFEFLAEMGLAADKPSAPLIVILFADSDAYRAYSLRELGSGSSGSIGFYGMASNRVTVCLETAVNSRAMLLSGYHSADDPRSQFATHLVHEATHQLMCNSGIQTRFAPYPLWVGEGLATYFEVADPFAKNGWRQPGGLQSMRLDSLHAVFRAGPQFGLAEAISNDESFRQIVTAGDQYSMAWGVTHFLIKRHRKSYAQYLQHLATKSPLEPEDSSQRKAELQTHLPFDLSELSQRVADYFVGK